MTHSPADVLAQLLIALGLATDPEASPLGEWPVYVGMEPSSPDSCITVYDTTASGGDFRTMPDGALPDRYGIQVRVRSADYLTGYVKAWALREGLAVNAYANAVALDGANYIVHAATGLGDVLSLGKDAPSSKRSLFTINGNLVVKEQ